MAEYRSRLPNKYKDSIAHEASNYSAFPVETTTFGVESQRHIEKYGARDHWPVAVYPIPNETTSGKS